MARRRLAPPAPADAPASPPETGSVPPPRAALSPGFAPPIARAAADAAEAGAEAARAARRLREAEAEGRLLVDLPLEAVEAGHLARDRAPDAVPDEETEALIASLRAHGQRTPAEVVDLGGGRFGLISGWRRLDALRELHAETGEPRFAALRARVIGQGEAGGPADAAAYVAMVEENEIRVGLSPYERGRIAVVAAGQGAFESVEDAVDGLFAAASRAKRSKIRSFAAVHEALGGWLAHPARLPERLGLKLAEALRTGRTARRTLMVALMEADPARSAAAERALLERAAAQALEDATFFEPDGKQAKRGRPRAGSEEIAPGLHLYERLGPRGPVFELSGPRAEDPEVIEAARALLRRLGRG